MSVLGEGESWDKVGVIRDVIPPPSFRMEHLWSKSWIFRLIIFEIWTLKFGPTYLRFRIKFMRFWLKYSRFLSRYQNLTDLNWNQWYLNQILTKVFEIPNKIDDIQNKSLRFGYNLDQNLADFNQNLRDFDYFFIYV